MTEPIGTRLGYGFVPLPSAIRSARERRELSSDEFELLSFLYDRADKTALAERLETPRLALTTMMRAVAWQKQDASFTKMLWRLREKSYYEYRVTRSGNGFLYHFTLKPDRGSEAPENPSDMRPTLSADPSPTLASGQTAYLSGDPASNDKRLSDTSEDGSPPSCPTPSLICPTLDEAQSRTVEPNPVLTAVEPVRVPKTLRETLNLASKERIRDVDSSNPFEQELTRTRWLAEQLALEGEGLARRRERFE